MRENLSARYKRQSKLNKIYMTLLFFAVDLIMIGKFCMSPEFYKLRGLALSATIFINVIYIYLVVRNPFKIMLNKYCITPEQLDYDYRHAVEIVKDTMYIGDKYFFHMPTGSFLLIKNTDIVWIYKSYYYKGNSSYSKCDTIVIYTIEKKKYEFVVPYTVTVEGIDRIEKFYAENFPHVVIGDGLERRRLFKEEFDRFLYMQYYSGLQKESAYEKKSIEK